QDPFGCGEGRAWDRNPRPALRALGGIRWARVSKGSDCSPLIPRSADPSGAGGRELLLQQVCAAEVGRAARPVEWEEGAAQRVPGRSSEVRGWPDIADEDGDS